MRLTVGGRPRKPRARRPPPRRLSWNWSRSRTCRRRLANDDTPRRPWPPDRCPTWADTRRRSACDRSRIRRSVRCTGRWHTWTPRRRRRGSTWTRPRLSFPARRSRSRSPSPRSRSRSSSCHRCLARACRCRMRLRPTLAVVRARVHACACVCACVRVCVCWREGRGVMAVGFVRGGGSWPPAELCHCAPGSFF